MVTAPTVHGFGTAGQATATQLFEILHSNNPQMALEWMPESKRLKLTGYSHMSDDAITKAINQTPYSGWTPKLAGRTSSGDIMIKLTPTAFEDEPQPERRFQPTHEGTGVTDRARRFSFFLPYLRGKSVLDVGCGNGITTGRLATETGVTQLTALEPGSEYDFIQAQKHLSAFQVPVEKLRLQQAVRHKNFHQKFDVVTVFKYNVPMAEKDEFVFALSEAVKPDGVVIVTSVELDRFNKGPGMDSALYLVGTLSTRFRSVQIFDICHDQAFKEQVAICRV